MKPFSYTVQIPEHIENILFDMDDVLVLTRALDKRVKEKIFASLGLRWSQVAPYAHLIIKEIFSKVFRDFNIKENPAKYAEIYFKEYDKALMDSVEQNVVPGVVQLIEKLSKKYRLVLVTSSTSAQAKIVCQMLGVESAFEFFITADDIAQGKPSPEPYQKAIQKLAARPEECLVIEDAPVGIISAKGVDKNLLVLAITTTSPKEKLGEADFIINSFSQIKVKHQVKKSGP